MSQLLVPFRSALRQQTGSSLGGTWDSSTDQVGDVGAESMEAGEGGAMSSDGKFAGVAGEGATETAFNGGATRAGRDATVAESA